VRACGLWPSVADAEIDLVTLTTPELTQDKDSCLLATMAIEEGAGPAGKTVERVVFAGHSLVWQRLRNNGPPAGQTREGFLSLLARHEVYEYIALRAELAGDPAVIAKHPWFTAFNAYLANNSLERNSESFHSFIIECAKRDAKVPGADLAEQAQLLRFIGDILEKQEIVNMADYPKGFGKARLAALDNAVIRGYTLKEDGTLYIGERKWGKFKEHAGEKVDIAVRNGYVTKVMFTADGTSQDFVLLEDNRTGAVVESFSGKLRAERLAELDDITIRNFTLNSGGRIEFGGKSYVRFPERPGETVDIVLKDGHIRTVIFRSDNTREELTQIVDNAAGAILKTFARKLTEDEMKGYEDATIKDYRLTEKGWLNLGGDGMRFDNRGGELIDVVIKAGNIAKVMFQQDGTEQVFRKIIDSAGTVVKSIRRNAKGFKSADKMVLENQPLSDKGNLYFAHRVVATFPDRAGERASIAVENGVVRKVIFADGTEQELALIYDPAQHKVVDSFLQSEKMPGCRNAVLRKCRVGDDGFVRFGTRIYGGCESYPGTALDVTVEEGKPVTGLLTSGPGKGTALPLALYVSRSSPGEKEPAVQDQREFPGTAVMNLSLTDKGNLYFAQKLVASFPERAGETISVQLVNGVVQKVIFNDGSEKELLLVYDRENGKALRSFDPDGRIPNLKNAFITGCRVGADGMLRLGRREYSGLAR
jgi:hypothetical protein